MMIVQRGTQCLRPQLTATAEPLPELMRRQEQQCAVISGYPDAVPPACSGTASICSFANSFLGCCESSGSCTFHTVCYGYWAGASCTGSCTSAGLVCPSSAPSCSRYIINDAGTTGQWLGFSCGAQEATIYATATSNVYASSRDSSIMSYQNPYSSFLPSNTVLALTSSQTGSNSNIIASSTSASSTSVATDVSPGNSTPKKSNNRAIIGGTVGGAVALGLLLGLIIVYLRKRRPGRRPLPELAQRRSNI